jgi:phosphatidylserine/phosphatidylglycerophosphate/cardiolipin synthase-like enzyme
MPEPPARVEIHVRTPHGEPVSGATVELVGREGQHPATPDTTAPGVYHAALHGFDDYLLTVARYRRPGGHDHQTLRATLFFSGFSVAEGRAPQLIAMEQPDGDRGGVSAITREGGLFRVHVTLDYLWFTHIGYPPTLGNRVDVLVDGEEAWSAIARALDQALRYVHLTTWAYEPTAELVREAPLADPPERGPFTIQSMLERKASHGVLVRLLLWDAPLFNIPRDARRLARAPGDFFEVMQEANPTRRPLFSEEGGAFYNRVLGTFQIGSHHQKTIVMDGAVGFCTGMNLKENDWDSVAHAPFDPRRCRFERPSSYREEVMARLAREDHRPRHDFTARVEGPAVKHLEANFHERWNSLIERGAEYSEHATPIAGSPPPALALDAPGTASDVQVVRTMPAPKRERGILDLYLRAVRAARRYIYIENQYFRSIHLSTAIADAVRARPDLELLVVTTQAHADTPLAGSFSRECFERIQRYRPGFELYALKVGAPDAEGNIVLEEVDNHAKLMIVDDLFLTVGSCNINDRGFEFEGELNLAVVDPALAQGLRLRLWRDHLGEGAALTGDIDNDVRVWKEIAERSRAYDVVSGTPPPSHIFPFEPRPNRTVLFGPDVF